MIDGPDLIGYNVEDIAKVLASRHDLTHLYLGTYSFTLVCLISALSVGHQFGDEGARHLAPILAKLTNLTRLELGTFHSNLSSIYTLLDNNQFGDEAARHLAPALAKLTNLKTLSLGTFSFSLVSLISCQAKTNLEMKLRYI